MPHIKAVLFDCDGVLTDTEDLGNRLLCEMAQDHGFGTDRFAWAMERFRGLNLAKCISEIESVAKLRLPSDFVDSYRARLEAKLQTSLKAVDGIERVLSSLERHRMPLCVVSGAPLKKLRFMLERLELARYFDDRIYSSYELDLWKPDPGLFLHAARMLGQAPGDVAVVEDSDLGVQAGVSAGMTVFHYVPGALASTRGAVTVFGRMPDLLGLLDSEDCSRPALG